MGGQQKERSGRTDARKTSEPHSGRSESERPAPDGSGGAKSPGRVVFDSRGNPIWEWENADDGTSLLLKRLENDALELEPTRPVRTPAKAGGGKPAKGSVNLGRTSPSQEGPSEDEAGGFDPYNRS